MPSGPCWWPGAHRVVNAVITAPFGDTGWFVQGLVAAVATVVTLPYGVLVGVLLYLDLRARKEALTIEALEPTSRHQRSDAADPLGRAAEHGWCSAAMSPMSWSSGRRRPGCARPSPPTRRAARSWWWASAAATTPTLGPDRRRHQRRPDGGGVQLPDARGDGPGHPDRRAAGRDRPDHGTDDGIVVATTLSASTLAGDPPWTPPRSVDRSPRSQ